MKSRSLVFVLPLCLAAFPNARVVACEVRSQEPAAVEAIVELPADAPLSEQRVQLLELAFQVASALPANPHIKNRCRIQAEVVSACLELDQPRHALPWIERIDDWRRGTAYGDLAIHWAGRGQAAEARRCLELARLVFETTESEESGGSSQGWRRDRIRVKIAQAYVLLDQAEHAALYEAGTAESEVGKLAETRAQRASEEDFEPQVRMLDAIIATGSFDQVRQALDAYVQLFGRFYADADRRALVEQKIRAGWSKLPVQIRVETSMALIEVALEQGDRPKALELIAQTLQLIDSATWIAEDHVPMLARLAGLRHRAGDAERAREEAKAAHGLYDAKHDTIVDIYRAQALRSIAEAYAVLGERAAALEAYGLALEAGTLNPNSRPRAEDLAATCCSMARRGIEPDAALWMRIRRIAEGLGRPW